MHSEAKYKRARLVGPSAQLAYQAAEEAQRNEMRLRLKAQKQRSASRAKARVQMKSTNPMDRGTVGLGGAQLKGGSGKSMRSAFFSQSRNW